MNTTLPEAHPGIQANIAVSPTSAPASRNAVSRSSAVWMRGPSGSGRGVQAARARISGRARRSGVARMTRVYSGEGTGVANIRDDAIGRASGIPRPPSLRSRRARNDVGEWRLLLLSFRGSPEPSVRFRASTAEGRPRNRWGVVMREGVGRAVNADGDATVG